MALDPYGNASYETNPYSRAQADRDLIQKVLAEKQMKHAAYMAQQQERFQPISSGAIAGATVSRPLDLAGELHTYDNLLGGLMEQIDALEHRLGSILLDYQNHTMEKDTGPDPMGSPLTMRAYHLNSALRNAAERVARITQAVNL